MRLFVQLGRFDNVSHGCSILPVDVDLVTSLQFVQTVKHGRSDIRVYVAENHSWTRLTWFGATPPPTCLIGVRWCLDLIVALGGWGDTGCVVF